MAYFSIHLTIIGSRKITSDRKVTVKFNSYDKHVVSRSPNHAETRKIRNSLGCMKLFKIIIGRAEKRKIDKMKTLV